MNPTRTSNDHLIVEATLHQENDERLLLLRLEAIDRSDIDPATPLQIALVIDRSGSMAGEKLEIAKQAAIDMVGSLSEDDRVGVVVYDDQVDVLQNLTIPGESVIRKICRIECGGSTNLYGGWLQGARLLNPGGHVVLLSDGLANVGLITTAEELENEAAREFRQHGVTTSTIGVGMDYDECLMTRMANAGKGAHYFARTAQSIRKAFENERFLMLSTSITDLEAVWPGGSFQVARLIDGEVRYCVVEAPDPSLQEVQISYEDAKTNERCSLTVPLPSEPIVEPLATAHLLAHKVSNLMARSLDLRSSQAAKQLHDEAGELLQKIAAHPMAESELLQEARMLLERLHLETERLWRVYDEDEATLVRKLGYGRGSRMLSSLYSLFAEDIVSVRQSDLSRPSLLADDDALVRDIAHLVPEEVWRRLEVAPVGVKGKTVIVAAVDFRNGIALGELSRMLGRRVAPMRALHTREEIHRMLDELFRQP